MRVLIIEDNPGIAANVSDFLASRGLWLSLVKRICDRYGWRIDITSEPGAGTRVQLSFGAAPSTTIPV